MSEPYGPDFTYYFQYQQYILLILKVSKFIKIDNYLLSILVVDTI